MKTAFFIFFCILGLSLNISIAAMEVATWSLIILGCIYWFTNWFKSKIPFLSAVKILKLGPDWALLIYAVFVTLGVLIAPKTILSHLQILGFLRWIILLYVMTYLLSYLEERKLKIVLSFLALGLCLAGSYGLIQFFLGMEFFRSDRLILYPYGGYWRATGFFSGSLTYAYSLGMGGLLLGGFTFYKTFRTKATASLLLAGLGVGASMARGAWIGFCISLVAIWAEVPRRWRYLCVVFAILAVTSLYNFSPVLQLRVASLFDEKVQSNQQRIAIWESNWEIFKDHPLIGVGLTRNSEYLPEYYNKLGYDNVKFIGHAHSNYLQVLSGAGIFAFISYMIFITYFLYLSYKLWRGAPARSWARGLGLGAFSAQIFFHIGGLTECNFTDGEVNHMLIFTWALVCSRTYLNNRPRS